MQPRLAARADATWISRTVPSGRNYCHPRGTGSLARVKHALKEEPWRFELQRVLSSSRLERDAVTNLLAVPNKRRRQGTILQPVLGALVFKTNRYSISLHLRKYPREDSNLHGLLVHQILNLRRLPVTPLGHQCGRQDSNLHGV